MMKKIILTLALIFSFILINEVRAVNKTSIQTEFKKEDPSKICRYYAIMEANNTGYPYGSPAWQQEYKFYFDSCMDQIQ